MTILVIIVALFNFVFFAVKPDSHDDSLAFGLLKNHTALNEKLYNRYSSIKTTVASSNSLVSAAYADAPADALPSNTTDGGQPTPDASNSEQDFMSQGTEGGLVTMVRPNPDSIADLVAKQIKVYTVQDGDYTVYPVAAKFGISYKTIMWANNLKDVNLKKGWELIILPTDGVLVKANSNTTLPDLVKKYGHGKVTLEDIVGYNGFADAEAFDTGQYIIIPGGEMPAPQSPPRPRPAPGSPNPSDNLQDQGSHAFPWGYCTWYVAHKRPIKWGGNAKNWLANARAMGYETGHLPTVGAIMASDESRRFGHVALVEKVNNDGTFEVSEMNFDHFGRVDHRTISVNSRAIKGFIY